MTNNIELRNENGQIVGYDSDGNKVPISFEDGEFESLNANNIASDTGKIEPRLEALYRANQIRNIAGLPQSETVGPQTTPGTTAGLTAETKLVINSESDASGEALSGSGTKSDPYVIKDRDQDNSESGGDFGVEWQDPEASYYLKLKNCKIRNYDSAQILVDTGTKLTVEDCELFTGTGGGETSQNIIRTNGGNLEVINSHISGAQDDAILMRSSGTLTVTDCLFDEATNSWAEAWAINSDQDPRPDSITVEFSEITPSGGEGAVRATNTDVTVRNCDIRNMDRGTIFNDVNSGQIRFCNFVINGGGWPAGNQSVQNVDIEHCDFQVDNAPTEVIQFDDSFGSASKACSVERCYVEDNRGSGGGAGTEVMVTRNSSDIAFRECWVEGAYEDCYEFVASSDCAAIDVVADNCDSEIVDCFGSINGAGGFSDHLIDGVYGNCVGEAVIVTDSDGVTVRRVHANSGENAVEIEQRNAPAGFASDITVMGPLPLAEVTTGSILAEKGDVGTIRALYLDNNNIQTPFASPRQTELR